MKLNIIHLNVLNWNSHKHIISNYILQNDPDIITLNAHSLLDTKQNIHIQGYTGYTKGHGIHSGVAILIKRLDFPVIHTK